MRQLTAQTKNKSLLILRRVNLELEVHGNFLGLYHIASIDAATLTTAIKDVLIRLNVPFDNFEDSVMMEQVP